MRHNVTIRMTTLLHFWTCFFLDSEDGNYPSVNPNHSLKCISQGKFLAGSGETGQYYGHAICIGICVLIYVIGLFGFFTNIINVLVLKKSLRGSSDSLKRLLIILAVFELLACVFSIAFTTVIVIILENASRTHAAFQSLRTLHILYSFARTAAIYITFLVTLERYLVIAYPIKSKSWLTPVKSRIYLTIVVILVLFLDVPWIFNSQVVKNPFIELAPNTTLADFPYILNGTTFGRVVYPKVKYLLLVLNYVAPFPLLLTFNGLLYRSIFKWHKGRQALTRKQKKEISIAKVFSIAVLILMACHSVSCILFFIAQHLHVVYRELMLLQLLSVTLSASVNFLVYMGFGKAYRQELKRLMISLWISLGGRGQVPPPIQTSLVESSAQPETKRTSWTESRSRENEKGN